MNVGDGQAPKPIVRYACNADKPVCIGQGMAPFGEDAAAHIVPTATTLIVAETSSTSPEPSVPNRIVTSFRTWWANRRTAPETPPPSDDALPLPPALPDDDMLTQSSQIFETRPATILGNTASNARFWQQANGEAKIDPLDRDFRVGDDGTLKSNGMVSFIEAAAQLGHQAVFTRFCTPLANALLTAEPDLNDIERCAFRALNLFGSPAPVTDAFNMQQQLVEILVSSWVRRHLLSPQRYAPIDLDAWFNAAVKRAFPTTDLTDKSVRWVYAAHPEDKRPPPRHPFDRPRAATNFDRFAARLRALIPMQEALANASAVLPTCQLLPDVEQWKRNNLRDYPAIEPWLEQLPTIDPHEIYVKWGNRYQTDSDSGITYDSRSKILWHGIEPLLDALFEIAQETATPGVQIFTADWRQQDKRTPATLLESMVRFRKALVGSTKLVHAAIGSILDEALSPFRLEGEAQSRDRLAVFGQLADDQLLRACPGSAGEIVQALRNNRRLTLRLGQPLLLSALGPSVEEIVGILRFSPDAPIPQPTRIIFADCLSRATREDWRTLFAQERPHDELLHDLGRLGALEALANLLGWLKPGSPLPFGHTQALQPEDRKTLFAIIKTAPAARPADENARARALAYTAKRYRTGILNGTAPADALHAYIDHDSEEVEDGKQRCESSVALVDTLLDPRSRADSATYLDAKNDQGRTVRQRLYALRPDTLKRWSKPT